MDFFVKGMGVRKGRSLECMPPRAVHLTVVPVGPSPWQLKTLFEGAEQASHSNPRLAINLAVANIV